jgi:hypothetical protein
LKGKSVLLAFVMLLHFQVAHSLTNWGCRSHLEHANAVVNNKSIDPCAVMTAFCRSLKILAGAIAGLVLGAFITNFILAFLIVTEMIGIDYERTVPYTGGMAIVGALLGVYITTRNLWRRRAEAN